MNRTFVFVFLLIGVTFVVCQRDFLIFEALKRQTQKESGGNFIIRYPNTRDHTRKQHQFPLSMQFPCINSTLFGVGRSKIPPTSVHKLRPGDIDVVGAMGDSLVAGNGAMEEWALGTMIEYRGISWCAGGLGTWRQFLTLPNILKEYNTNLTGFSTGTGEFLSQHAQLNVAYPVAADSDALRQAKILVRKIKSNKNIDFQNHWKMITLFFGANDLCSAQCFDRKEAAPENHGRKLMRALDYLQEHLPRTFVNLVPVLDVTVSVRVKRTLICGFLHTLFCSCFHRGRTESEEMAIISQLSRQYQQAEENLISSGRYDKKDDFTVVLQPFIKFFNMPLQPHRRYEEAIDISYITYDCFHFSQKGHALAANLLWNNLLQPVGRKSVEKLGYVMQKFQCPTPEAPYFFTNKNSKSFLETGRQ